jgi:hypothetical protein
MKALESIQPMYNALIERMIILNICKEATSIGIKLKAIPTTCSGAGRVLSSMLDKLCPKLEKKVQHYTVKSIGNYRPIIQDVHATLCPWSVQFLPIEGCKIPVSRLIRSVLPSISSSKFDQHQIHGAVGSFAASYGFKMNYRVGTTGDVRFLAGPTQESVMKYLEKDDDMVNQARVAEMVERELAIVRENMISPLAFCRCIRAIYNKVVEAADEATKALDYLTIARKKMVEVAGQPAAAKPKKEKIVLERTSPVREKIKIERVL